MTHFLIRVFAGLALLLASTACRTSPEGRPGVPAGSSAAALPTVLDSRGCPTEQTDLDVRACQAALPVGWGVDADVPMELGLLGGAGMDGPWRDRLVCPGGGIPVFETRGSVISRHVSTSPVSEASTEPLDMVDQWTVRCPGDRRFFLYNNLYRCGTVCVPPPFDLIPLASERASLNASRLVREQKFEDAVAEARRAVELGPQSERTLRHLAMTLVRGGRFDEASQVLARALRIHPEDPTLRYYRAVALFQAGNEPEALAEAELAADRMPPEAGGHRSLHCLRAMIHWRAQRLPEAQEAMRTACGDRGECCSE